MKKIIFFIICIFNLFALDKNIVLENIETNHRGNWKRLGRQTSSIALLSVGTMGILYIMPESVSNWEGESFDEMTKDWSSHIKSGPRFDPDDIFLNYIAHPYIGSAYYIAARKSDFNSFDSFLYSFTMSTFFWEYGIEAFAEIPSIQDIILTPVFGALIGEYFYRKEFEIRKNNSQIAGSKFLGKVALILIDPIGSFASLIGLGEENIDGMWTFGRVKTEEDIYENTVGIVFVYKF